MQLSGWGRFPIISARMLEPANTRAAEAHLAEVLNSGEPGLIARGAGCSYGDAALAPTVLATRQLDHFIGFSADSEEDATIHCAGGVSLDAVLRVVVPRGYFLPVLPGTRFVSVGGAIAADVHGKNHHRDGCFSNFVESFSLLLANGEIRHCNRNENSELFAATCGGMGLTGIILDARLVLKKVPGLLINNETIIADDLDECLELLKRHEDHQYSVAWIDCLSRGKQLGRGCIFLGDHADEPLPNKGYRHLSGTLASVPFSTPDWLLNGATMRGFNSLYYQRQKLRKRQSQVHYQNYFFPLDRIKHWNRLYGRKGFIQYQLVLPADSAQQGMQQVLQRVSETGKGSFLAVLKQFGAANDNPLSFPLEGFTLTLDFKMEDSLLPLLEELDAIVIDHGGRLYLAKDARMSEAVFKAGYPRWQEFMAVRAAVDPEGHFESLLAQRLGLGVTGTGTINKESQP